LGIAGAVAFAWLSWLYLGLDTVTAGVLQNQRYVPFAASVRQDPGSMLRYARAAQTLNGYRGVPVLAEAALLDQRLRQEPNSVYLREQALNTFRRAGQADPWNPLTQMLMIRFIEANPAILPQLREDETPESLLLRAVAIDPLYVPAVDALIDRLTREKRHAQAYGLLRDRVYPWMILLARQDKAAAQRYLQFLQAVAEARDERAFAAELAELRPVIEGTREVVKARWLF
jgi:hypothetical protein